MVKTKSLMAYCHGGVRTVNHGGGLMKIQKPTETTCWDGGEHNDSLSGVGGEYAACGKCGAIFQWDGLDWQVFHIPTIYDDIVPKEGEK